MSLEFAEIKNGVINYIDEKTFNEKIKQYKLHIKKYASFFRIQGFNYVLVSLKDKTSGVIDIKGFASKNELDIYIAGKIANIVYL